jgi:hypothetical protein
MRGEPMIKNFEEIKKQLSELSGVINSFKSESVQLKIVELIFRVTEEKTEDFSEEPVKKKKTGKKGHSKESTTESKKKKNTPSGQGAVSMLLKLFEGDFFKKPRTISNLVQHGEVNFAKKFKANEFSGKLARMVRSNQLKRNKNKDGQYEYSK